MTRNKKRKSEQTQTDFPVKEEEREKEGGYMFWIPVLVSLLSLGISCYAAYIQHTYANADYEYQRDPKFEMTAKLQYVPMLQGNEYKTLVSISDFSIKILERNNIERLYLISPSKEVHEINLDGTMEKQFEDYFNQAYESHLPDLLEKNGTIAYFYRFLVYSSLDDELEINVLYVKTEVLEEKNNFSSPVQIEFIDRIKILEFEKAHPGDATYAGERKIAAEYRELEAYLQNER